ncbi:MAG TPA: pentapeptide repeat-containing protein [Nostocaceae cyanobacterium]|nr:pentapeptide repeat-containing protein [Nostocaceae cyanobacterium]
MMKKQPDKIIKIAPNTVTGQVSAINHYVLKCREIFQNQKLEAIPRKVLFSLLGVLLSSLVIFYLLLGGNISNGLNQSTYQLSRLSQSSNYPQPMILSDYLNTMTRLILEENPQQIKHQSAIFRAMTQATLQQLNPEYKRYIVLFLQDANLLQIPAAYNQQPLLWGANLMGANLEGLNLKSANFQGANLASVDFRGADLRGVKLENANLENACYNGSTVFNKTFQPQSAGMKELKTSHKCF